MKRYERKWKHICLKRVAHRSVQESTEPKTETRKEQREAIGSTKIAITFSYINEGRSFVGDGREITFS